VVKVKVLWWIIRVLWRKRIIPSSWCIAEGVYIPKESQARELGQFRPISLLNIDGKVFMSVLARRLTAYVMNNRFIDISIQKAGVPGFPGCIEHAHMIWECIQRHKKEKKDLDVIWLDLANAYGSIPHRFLQFALEFFWVPGAVREMVKKYYGQFKMRFTTREYTTQWQPLEVGIPMGCPVSPLLFVMGMEVIIRAVAPGFEGVELNPGVRTPSVRAFMDDLTIISSEREQVVEGLKHLDDLIAWTGMRFKPKKSRSLSIRKGKVVGRKFCVGGETVPTVMEQGVKSLGRWYERQLTDKHRGVQVFEQAREWLKTIDGTLLPGSAKVWCCQFGIMPRLTWQLSVYDIAVSRVEKLQQCMSVFYRKWLGVPRMLTDVALYCKSSKLRLPMASVVEEYKVGKVRLAMMLRQSKDEAIARSEPVVETGKRWRAEEATDKAVADAKWREIQGAVQRGRSGLGSSKMKWFSKVGSKGKRELVIDCVRGEEDNARMCKAAQQGVQGAWVSWEEVDQRVVSWETLLRTSAGSIKFLISSTYDTCPTPVNLKRWNLAQDDVCCSCKRERGSLEHTLSACSSLLRAYTWRHNQVLAVLKEAVEEAISERKGGGKHGTTKLVKFVREGERVTRQQRAMAAWRDGLADGEWVMKVDEGSATVPCDVVVTNLRPDMVLVNRRLRALVLMELTVPWETRMQAAHERKLLRYAELKDECEDRGWRTEVFAVEVGCRGFTGWSLRQWLKRVGVSGKKMAAVVRRCRDAAEVGSAWIVGKLMSGGGGAVD
jgi:hypothetical protein